VIFAGAKERSEIPEYIDAFDIALQPRVTSYACPMKIIEYLAMGKVIIAPDQENIRDILIDQENAILFDPGDMCDLNIKIQSIINKSEFKKELSKNALETIIGKKLIWTENAGKAISLIGGLDV